MLPTKHLTLFKGPRPYVWSKDLALKLLNKFLSQVGDEMGGEK